MKPIKKISDPDGQKQEEESLEEVRKKMSKIAASQVFNMLDLANYFDALGVDTDDPGLSAYAADMDNIIRRMIKNDS